MKVLVLAPYPLRRAPSQRFRWEQYLLPLRERGIFLEPSTFLNDAGMDIIHGSGAWRVKASAVFAGAARRLRDVRRIRQYDLVLVHRESLPIGPAWPEWLIARAGVRYAFDFDDAVYLPATSAANRRLARFKGAGKTIGVVRGASLVLAGNGYLRDWASAYNPRVKVVPTTIDTDHYVPPIRRTDGPVRVGWSGSLSTIEHLKLLEPVLRELQQRSGIQIRIIGGGDYRMPGTETENLVWNERSEVEDLRGIDIGVMPLPDDEWARGKCGLKALQYMALAIPTVVSPVGVNCEIARDGAALLASTQEEWRQALGKLIDDPGLRAQVGTAGRVRVEQEYSVKAKLPLWEESLREAAGG